MSIEKTLSAARAAAAAKDYVKSETLLREVLRTEPNHVPALDLLGFVLYLQDQPEAGEQVCQIGRAHV